MRLAGLLAFILITLTGCARRNQAKVQVPPPPPIQSGTSQNSSREKHSQREEPSLSEAAVNKESDKDSNDAEAVRIPLDAKPLAIETGLASWYGPPYHNRRGSDGHIYNMNAMTAAHRTLPLGSIVRVTNSKTGNSAIVRITDRGPFIKGRMLDLSLAAAKKVDVWKAGVTTVRIEVLQTPAPLSTGGRWAVQIGAFKDEEGATNLAEHLSRRYQTAKVSSFSSPVGDWWVKVRVQHDARDRAEKIVSETQTSEGTIFLVRLD